MKQYLYVLSLSVFSLFFANAANALVAPYFVHGNISTLSGDFSVIEENRLSDTGAISFWGGFDWRCFHTPGCGISINPGASTAYAEVTLDPLTGTLGARAGSLGYVNFGGFGTAYGYVSQVFSVGTDGTLQPGDNVSVDVNMLLEGVIDIDSQNATAAGMSVLNYFDPSRQYIDFDGSPVDFIPLSTFQDLFFTPNMFGTELGRVQHMANQPTTTVNFQSTATAEVNVGDVLVLETMIFVDNHLGFSPDLGQSWTEFHSTLSSSLTTSTSGATLNVIPVPAAVWLFGSGLLGLIGIARRKKA
jgi:hypothetical protein